MKTITKIIPDASPGPCVAHENLHFTKCGLEFLWQLHYGAINLFSLRQFMVDSEEEILLPLEKKSLNIPWARATDSF